MKEKPGTVVLAAILFILSIISLFIGVIDLKPGGLFNGDFEQIEILFITRLPRLMAIICTGVGMSVAGLIMQKLCMNKFVSPTTGATIASSQFGILLAMLFLPNARLMDKTMFAFGAALIGTYLFVYFIQKIKFKDIILVPLVGIMFGNIIGGITDYLAYKYDMAQSLSAWLVGDFSLILRGRYEIVYLALPLVVIAFMYANHFNIVGMGEDFSKNLGLNYNLILFMGLSIAALITASIVVIVGNIPYLGLIVPNIVVMFKGDRIRGTLVDTALFGAVFVLFCDIVGRVIIYPYEVPINLTVGVIGSLIFLFLLVRQLNPQGRSKGKKDQFVLKKAKGEGDMLYDTSP